MHFYLSPTVGIKNHNGQIIIHSNTDCILINEPDIPALELLRALIKGIDAGQLFLFTDNSNSCEKLYALLADQKWIIHENESEFRGKLYEKQFGYLAQFESRPSVIQRKINDCKIGIVGLGGIGSILIQNLVGTGFNDFVIVDGDDVSIDNLNRQYLFSLKNVGLKKTEVVESYIKGNNPTAIVQRIDQYITRQEDLNPCDLERCDIVVLCADKPVGIADLIDFFCKSYNIPFTMAFAGLNKGFIGPFCTYKNNNDYATFKLKLQSSLTDLEKYLFQNDNAPLRNSFGPVNSVIASFLSLEIVNYLICPDLVKSLGKRMFIDCIQLKMQIFPDDK